MKQAHPIWGRVAATATLLASCSAPEPSARDAGDDVATFDADAGPVQRMLIDHTAWRQLAPTDDPFGESRDSVDCAPAFGWAVELLTVEQSLGVDTNFCDLFIGEHPSLDDVRSGDRILVRLWHFQLIGGGEAHLGLAFGDEVVWDHTIAMPTDSGALIVGDVLAPSDFPAGTPIRFHLHNHGANSYNLIEVTTAPPEDKP